MPVYLLHKHLDALRIPRVTFHSLRHYAVSRMLAAGFSPREVMEIVGHATVGMTMEVYAHAAPSELRRKMEGL